MAVDGDAGVAGGLLAGFGPGRLVAGYRLEEQIGAGGMAVVFRAVEERLGRRVALKILVPALTADQAFRQRFIHESRAAAAVDDPHIIPVYDAGEAAGVLFIAMRLVPGRDLRTMLQKDGHLSPGRAAAIISPVASALDTAHRAGLVHRDVKPANMLIDTRPDRPDHVYLSDFGLSKEALASAGLTGSGQFLGTPSYVSPEQIQGRTVDGRADQYSLACTAFEVLTGAPPFARDQALAVIWAHVSEPPPPAQSLRAGLPAGVDEVLARALAKSAADRYPTCGEFAEALRAALSLAPYHARPGTWPGTWPAAGPGADSPEPPGLAPVPGAVPMAAAEDTGTLPSERPPRLAGDHDLPTMAVPRFFAGRLAGRRRPEAPVPSPAEDGDGVTSVAFSPDGATLAIASSRGQVRLCGAMSGRVIEDLTANLAPPEPAGPDPAERGVEAIAYSPDGGMLAVGGIDGSTRLWDLRWRRLRSVLAEPGLSGIGAVAFSPDGARLAAGGGNGSVYLWEVSTGRMIGALANPESEGVFALAFAPGGYFLAAGDGSGVAYLWDAANLRLIASMARRGSGAIFSVSFAPDGSSLATGSGDGGVRLWDPRTGAHLTDLTRRGAAFSAVFATAFNPRSLELAAGYRAGGVGLWDAETGRQIIVLGRRDRDAVLSVAYSPDGGTLAVGHSQGAVSRWDLGTGTRITIYA